MILQPSYHNGFAPRDDAPLFPELWRGCVGAWNPGLGPNGLRLYDWSKNKNHGTLTSMSADTAWVKSHGRYGLEAALSTSEKIAVPSANALNSFGAGDFYVYASFAKSTTAAGGIIAKYRDTSPVGGWSITLNSTIVVGEVIAVGPGYNSIVVSKSICDGLPHSVVMQRAGVVVQLWIDGRLEGSLNYSAISLANATPELWIGNYFPGLNIPLGGTVFESRIGNGALSPQQIRLLASRPGIAYEMAPRHWTASQIAAYRKRQYSQLVGGGVI